MRDLLEERPGQNRLQAGLELYVAQMKQDSTVSRRLRSSLADRRPVLVAAMASLLYSETHNEGCRHDLSRIKVLTLAVAVAIRSTVSRGPRCPDG